VIERGYRRCPIMSKPISFALLKQFLEGLGCQHRMVPGSHVSFEHPPSGALIVLRPYREDETVNPTDLAIVRRILDEFGIVAGEGQQDPGR
jgi:hypothetical protein